MKKILTVLCVALCAATLIFASCGGSGGSSSLSGKWMLVLNGADAGMIYEFKKDGTGIMAFDDQGSDFTYKTDKNVLTVTLLGQDQQYEFKVSGSTLTLIDGKSKVESTLRKM